MADKNWSQIGDEIEDMVRNALETKRLWAIEPEYFQNRG